MGIALENGGRAEKAAEAGILIARPEGSKALESDVDSEKVHPGVVGWALGFRTGEVSA